MGRPVNWLPMVQLACGDPLPNLGRGRWFGEAAGVECDGLNVGETLGAPGEDGFCSTNDNERFGLHGDPCCSHCHGSLHALIAFALRTGPIVFEGRMKSLQRTHQKFSKPLERDIDGGRKELAGRHGERIELSWTVLSLGKAYISRQP